MNPFVVFSYFFKIHRHLSLKLIKLNSSLQTNICKSNFLKQKKFSCFSGLCMAGQSVLVGVVQLWNYFQLHKYIKETVHSK